MTEEQIQILRSLIQEEIDAAGIDGMEHGAWGWADKQLEEGWKNFEKSFRTPDELAQGLPKAPCDAL
jgi:hypothetical protein